MSLASLLKKGGLRLVATAIPATFATDAPPTTPKVAKVATVAVAKPEKVAANDPAPDPDRWCWPHSTAMNGSEIDLFTARLARFTDKGVIQIDSELIADKLVIRDRDDDDRRLCLECTHLHGYGVTSWRCGNWQAADIAINARNTQLAPDLVFKLQRCAGLTHAFTPAPVTQ